MVSIFSFWCSNDLWLIFQRFLPSGWKIHQIKNVALGDCLKIFLKICQTLKGALGFHWDILQYHFQRMDKRFFRPLLCTVKAELGRGQPGLMRWIWDETLPQSSIDRLTFYSAAHCATKWANGRLPFSKESVERLINSNNTMIFLPAVYQ